MFVYERPTVLPSGGAKGFLLTYVETRPPPHASAILPLCFCLLMDIFLPVVAGFHNLSLSLHGWSVLCGAGNLHNNVYVVSRRLKQAVLILIATRPLVLERL